MSPRLTINQPLSKQPTMWDSFAQVACLVVGGVGRVDGGYTFAHSLGFLACTRIARRLGNPEDRP